MTLSLEVSCSIQLSYRGQCWSDLRPQVVKNVVRVARIELASPAWKAGILATIRHPRFSEDMAIIPDPRSIFIIRAEP